MNLKLSEIVYHNFVVNSILFSGFLTSNHKNDNWLSLILCKYTKSKILTKTC